MYRVEQSLYNGSYSGGKNIQCVTHVLKVRRPRFYCIICCCDIYSYLDKGIITKSYTDAKSRVVRW